MVLKHDREERGVGLQNLRYAPAWDELCHIINIHSPRAYRALSEFLPMRSERSHRQKEARQPRFPTQICSRSFELIVEHLKALDYDGPVGVSCDETKLFSTYRLYWDGDQKQYYLIGGVDGPILCLNEDDIRHALEMNKDRIGTKVSFFCGLFQNNAHGNVSKVRLWCLTIPAPKMTPAVIAAIPVLDNMTAEELAPLSEQILLGLIDRNIHVISYACDGTETERAVLRLLKAKSDSMLQYTIPSPFPSTDEKVTITIPVFKGQPISMIQDSKHALKTLRNNLFSGARLLVMGNYISTYSRIRQIAHEDSPLYLRDVEKLDRQDDNAATRLFSADTLQYLCDHHPTYCGEIVYLFIFGELMDAYQNRAINHAERARMVLRARYFLNAWDRFLQKASYPKHIYMISREAIDICQYIVEGFLGLLFIHRDHLSAMHAFLPWLHSSEACEHIFGEARHVVKDFTMLDFVYMIPKLRVKVRQAILHAKTTNPRARASGYNHTYFDLSGLDLLTLASYPSDDEIGTAAKCAGEELDGLLGLLGISPGRLRQLQAEATPFLRGIGSWCNEEVVEDVVDEEGETPGELLTTLIQHIENPSTSSLSHKHNEKIVNLTSATLALIADDVTTVYVVGLIMMLKRTKTPSRLAIPDVNEQELDDINAEDYIELHNRLDKLKATLPDEPSKPTGLGLAKFDDIDFQALIEMRRHHQTAQAAKSSRRKGSGLEHDSNTVTDADDADPKQSLRRQLALQFHGIMREYKELGLGTGLERSKRWTTSAKGGQTADDPKASGNQANAIVSATAHATQASSVSVVIVYDSILHSI